MVPGEGFEPPTFGLQNRCTTTVLTRRSGAPRTEYSGRRLSASLDSCGQGDPERLTGAAAPCFRLSGQMGHVLHDRVAQQSLDAALASDAAVLDATERCFGARRDQVIDRQVANLNAVGEPVGIS